MGIESGSKVRGPLTNMVNVAWRSANCFPTWPGVSTRWPWFARWWPSCLCMRQATCFYILAACAPVLPASVHGQRTDWAARTRIYPDLCYWKAGRFRRGAEKIFLADIYPPITRQRPFRPRGFRWPTSFRLMFPGRSNGQNWICCCSRIVSWPSR